MTALGTSRRGLRLDSNATPLSRLLLARPWAPVCPREPTAAGAVVQGFGLSLHGPNSFVRQVGGDTSEGEVDVQLAYDTAGLPCLDDPWQLLACDRTG